jgi:DNA helicase-2/ATP-dependent DNA helicase PcrA
MELNAQQQRAVTCDGGHVLVLAGAGTGKTRTIIARAAYLIGAGVPPWRILLLTFTRRAAHEMIDRLRLMIGKPAEGILAGTFHHFCLRSMRRNQEAFGIEGATVIDRDDQLQLMRLIRSDYKEKNADFPKAAELVNLCSYARNTLQAPEAYMAAYTEHDEKTIEQICRVFEEFERRKRANRYLDYDDILSRFARRLNGDAALNREIRERYDHILVDEMQDTNPLQWQMLEGMRDPARLFCVGDDAQSIYAFRGADFRNVHAFSDRVPNAEILRLEENYRSTQGILDLSNWLLSESEIPYDKRLKANRTDESTPLLKDFDSEYEEADWITGDLVERRRAGRPWKDHMIITRTGFGARAVESYMVEKDIPYQFVGGTSLLQTAHVKDLLCLVRAADSHSDELAWARYLTLWPRIGDKSAARFINAMQKAENTEAALELLLPLLKGRSEIVDGPQAVRDHLDNPPGAIEQAARYLMPLMEKRYDKWKSRLRDFELLVRLAEKHRSLKGFMETYTLDPISISSAEQMGAEDVVTLTTVHSAKGTETPVCYLIRVEPGMYPHMRSLGSDEAKEEERRILYVAMTRARDELIITRTYHPNGWYSRPFSGGAKWGGAQGQNYFIEDLDEPLVRR